MLAFALSITTVQSQGFVDVTLSNAKKSARYKGYITCDHETKSWRRGFMKTKMYKLPDSTKRYGDTLVFLYENPAIYNLWLILPPNDKRYVLLKFINDKVFVQYDVSFVSAFEPGKLPNTFELVDMKAEVGKKVYGSGYFYYDGFSSTLSDKKFVKRLDDTVYRYDFSGREHVSHLLYVKGFLFSKKNGFLRWDYKLANGCLGFAVIARHKRRPLLPF